MGSIFKVTASVELATTAKRVARVIDVRESKMRLAVEGVSDHLGVYVFTMAAARGATPWYVGKTLGSFYGECFTNDKVRKYNEVLADHVRARPVLYFLSLQRTRGPIAANAIEELESILIGVALKRNPALLNVSKTRELGLTVRGVLNSTQGAPTLVSREFKSLMDL
ncbi:MAG TPA: hypothetical protein VGD01_08890 [Candidatus Elarobacter sp.]|jgi:hypothetical protein